VQEIKDQVKICISGLTASGKTTLINKLAHYYKCPYISFSTFLLREYGKILPHLISEKKPHYYWHYAGLLNYYRLKLLDFEKEIDKKFYRFIGSKRKFIFDSFTYPYLSFTSSQRPFCVLLDVGKKIRLARAGCSPNPLSNKELLKYIDEKDATTNFILKKIWNLDVTKKSYKEYFHLVINDGFLEKLGIGFKKCLNIKMHVVLSFANLYFYKNLKNKCRQNEKNLITHCQYLLKNYYPSVITDIRIG